MSLIDKDQAIDSVCINICGKSHNNCGFWKQHYRYCNACKFARLVESTPSIEKTGKWIDVENNIDYYPFMCSECHETVIKKTNYCPRCGANMS